MMGTFEDRSEIVFFDVETTVPARPGQGFAILEFGAILVCPKKLVELRHYATLVRPADLSHISTLSDRRSGINKNIVVSAPTFSEIADVVYDILHGRIWAGHNILRFDCARIREAFSEINRPAPEPKGTIDSLALLTQRFGRRAGDMKMASIAAYFGLGQQKHRSLDDVRMNLEVLKYCSTVLFLESSLSDIFTERSWVSPNATTRSCSNGKVFVEQTAQNTNSPNHSASPPRSNIMEENHPILSLMSPNIGELNLPINESNSAREDSFNIMALCDEIEKEPLSEEEERPNSTLQESLPAVGSEGTNGSIEFLEANDISIPYISVKHVSFYRGTKKLQVLHKNLPLQVSCKNLNVRFGISTKFLYYAGRPRLNFVVDASPGLCKVLDAIDALAQKKSVDSESCSKWRPVVIRKAGFFNTPTIRLHVPTVTDGETIRWATEIYQKDSSSPGKLVCSIFDEAELDTLFTPGNLMDAFFSLDAYDYQQNAGIRLVAKKLIVHSNL